MKKIAIFASGTGSNARKIIEYFADHSTIRVSLVVSNKKEAPVLEMARSQDVETLLIERTSFYQSEDLLRQLDSREIDFVVLAGFLWLIPAYLVRAFRGRMVNIHPALLPAYGGKGMYGMNVHRAVHSAGERESGITIHYVNDRYDEGAVIFQARCAIGPEDTPVDIAAKVRQLEHRHFAPVIESLLTTGSERPQAPGKLI